MRIIAIFAELTNQANPLPTMNRILLPIALVLTLVNGCAPGTSKKGKGAPAAVPAPDTVRMEARPEIPQAARMVIQAYPDQRLSYADNKLVFADGTSIVFDDGVEKDFVTKLDNADVEDMFSLDYDRNDRPAYLADAGRSRCEALFKKMYGRSAAKVRKNLVDVPWFGQTVKFTRVNGANRQLEKVAREIAGKYPELKKYMKSSGTFYWRKVRGANRQSAHSYGIAIDINAEYSDYWLWTYPGASETQEIAYVNRIPLEIVEVFEKHGFIWGGRWYHFDTMHFEYRPEYKTTPGFLRELQ